MKTRKKTEEAATPERADKPQDKTIIISKQFPACWEDEHTLRWGFEKAMARVRKPSAYASRVIEQLNGEGYPLLVAAPVPRSATAAARRREKQRLFRLLAPILETTQENELSQDQTTRPRAHTKSTGVALSPASRVTHELVQYLSVTNQTRVVSSRHKECRLLIRLEHYLEPAAILPHWQDSGLPQLYVRFTDTKIHIGPVLGLPDGPCHGCLVTTLLDSDPAITALAAQLIGSIPHTAKHAPWAQIANTIQHFAELLTRAPDVAASRQITLQQEPHGLWEATLQKLRPHPQCGCRSLAQIEKQQSRGAPQPIA